MRPIPARELDASGLRSMSLLQPARLFTNLKPTYNPTKFFLS